MSSESTSAVVVVTLSDGVSIGPVITGAVAGIPVSVLFIGAILVVIVILWRHHVHRVRNKCMEFSSRNGRWCMW